MKKIREISVIRGQRKKRVIHGSKKKEYGKERRLEQVAQGVNRSAHRRSGFARHRVLHVVTHAIMAYDVFIRVVRGIGLALLGLVLM